MIYALLLLTGLLGGFLAGLVGIGGGLIYIFALVPLLAELAVPLRLVPSLTVANSILAVFFASTAASITLIKSKDFYFKDVTYVFDW